MVSDEGLTAAALSSFVLLWITYLLNSKAARNLEKRKMLYAIKLKNFESIIHDLRCMRERLETIKWMSDFKPDEKNIESSGILFTGQLISFFHLQTVLGTDTITKRLREWDAMVERIEQNPEGMKDEIIKWITETALNQIYFHTALFSHYHDNILKSADILRMLPDYERVGDNVGKVFYNISLQLLDYTNNEREGNGNENKLNELIKEFDDEYNNMIMAMYWELNHTIDGLNIFTIIIRRLFKKPYDNGESG